MVSRDILICYDHNFGAAQYFGQMLARVCNEPWSHQNVVGAIAKIYSDSCRHLEVSSAGGVVR